MTGATNPSGKLPVTFPRRLEDTPCFHNFPGESETVVYGEGLYLGYRHYDKAKVEPLFPFGYGLSYTTFSYSNATISSSVLEENGTIEVSIDITNTGSVFGKESVQFYVSQLSTPGLPRPIKELKGFDKVYLAPGETKTAKATLDKYSCGYWHQKNRSWTVDEKAEFQVWIGKNSRECIGTVNFSVAESESGKGWRWLF